MSTINNTREAIARKMCLTVITKLSHSQEISIPSWVPENATAEREYCTSVVESALHQLFLAAINEATARGEELAGEELEHVRTVLQTANRIRDEQANELATLRAENERLDWQTGIPPVELGGEDAFWCQYEYKQNGETRIGYGLLEYRNKYVALASDWAEPGPEEVEVGDSGEYEWTGWFEQSCDVCNTFWRCTKNIIAWMKLPRRDAAIDAAMSGEGGERT